MAGASEGVAAIDPAAYASLDGLDVVSGDRTAALNALEDGPSFLAPAGLAAATGWTVGSQLPVATQNGIVYFTIVGVISHSFPSGDGGESLVMADDLARTYFGAAAGGFDDLVVTTRGSVTTVVATAASYGMQAVPVSVIASAARDALQHSIGLLLAVAVISVLIAMLAVVNTLLVNVRQGTRELALLRAVGLGSRQAMRRVLTEAGLLAAAATLIGVAAGCLIAVPMLQASTTPTFAPGFVLSRRDRDRAHPRRRAGRGRGHHRSSSQSGANLSAQRAAARVAPMRPVGGWRACGICSPSRRSRSPPAAAPRQRFPPAIPLHYLITIDQLVAPDFTVTSTAAHVDAATLAGGDSSLASGLSKDGLQSAASVEYQRDVDFSTSNGPIDIVATVERFAERGWSLERLRRERAPARRDCRVRRRHPPVRSATRRTRSAWCADDAERPSPPSRSPSCGASATSSTSSSREDATAEHASMMPSCSPVCRRRTNPHGKTRQFTRGQGQNETPALQAEPRTEETPAEAE